MNKPISAEQEERWQVDIADLVETISHLPPMVRIGPVFPLGKDVKVWKVQLEDGRTGWARQEFSYGSIPIRYYFPADVARLSEIKWLIAEGYTQEWARDPNSRESGVWVMCAADLLSVSAEEFAALKAQVHPIKERRGPQNS